MRNSVGSDAMAPDNAFDDASEAYEKLDAFWQGLRWRITGPLLILLGVSQAVFGWAGDSLWIRVGYSAACIAFGLFLMRILGWLCPPDGNEATAAIDAAAMPGDDQAPE